MIARLRVAGQETWHHNVTHASNTEGWLTLWLSGHPSRVHYWHADILLCATDEDVTEALREERGIVHEEDRVRRI